MAMTAKIKNRLDELVAALKGSKTLSLNERDDLIEIIAQAAEGTNGLTAEEKTQANSENIFNLCYLFIRDKLEGGGSRAGLYRLIYMCRHQITILGLGALGLLAFRPQVAALLEGAARIIVK